MDNTPAAVLSTADLLVLLGDHCDGGRFNVRVALFTYDSNCQGVGARSKERRGNGELKAGVLVCGIFEICRYILARDSVTGGERHAVNGDIYVARQGRL